MEVGAAAAAALPMHRLEAHTTKTFMELKWVSRPKTRIEKNPKTPSSPLQAIVPVFISTNPSHLNPDDLRDLFAACNRSCHRFPNFTDAGGGRSAVEAVDLHKLRIALSHSLVQVSVFCRKNDVIGDSESSSSSSSEQKKKNVDFGELLQNVVMPVTPFNSQLVGFGRAVSDLGLTASIYDVMVIPSLRGMGIGRMIVNRIIRMLTSRDIYDIAALCSENERSFFKGCGFGDDILGSTAMMYTRSSNASTDLEGNDQMVKRTGRKLLLVPPISKIKECSKTMESNVEASDIPPDEASR